MSTEITATQVARDALASTATPAVNSAGNRQNIAVADGKSLPPQEQKQEASAEKLQEVVSQLNDHVQMVQRDLHFSVDEQSGHTVIRVVNSATEELVRQIPSEEVLRISRNLEEQVDGITGLIVQTSA